MIFSLSLGHEISSNLSKEENHLVAEKKDTFKLSDNESLLPDQAWFRRVTRVETGSIFAVKERLC